MPISGVVPGKIVVASIFLFLYMMILDSRSIRAESYDSNVMNHSFGRFKIVLKMFALRENILSEKTSGLFSAD